MASQKDKEQQQEAKESLMSVAQGLSGKPITEEEVKKAYQDPEAQLTIDSVKKTFETKKRMKYSPATGKRYAPSMDICPETGVRLQWLEE